MSNLPAHSGVITINLDIKAYPLKGSESRIFEQGTQYYHYGTITKSLGCGPCGSMVDVPFFIVICDMSTYHVDSRYSSENVPTGPIPSMQGRIQNMGDGFDSSPTSDVVSEEEQARAKNFKLKM